MLAVHGIQIAPSTYYACAARGFGPTDAELTDAYAANDLHRLWVKHRRLYGRRTHRRLLAADPGLAGHHVQDDAAGAVGARAGIVYQTQDEL